jgi:hypothetical protein
VNRQPSQLLFFVLLVLGIFGCEKKSNQTPSFLVVDSVIMDVPSAQGNNIHEISALQVYANGDFLGLFEMPFKVPILKSGKTKFQFIPYVRLNGSKNQWAPHRCFISKDTFLTINTLSNTVYLPSFTLKDNAIVRFEEDFNDGNSKMKAVLLNKGDSLFVESRTFDLNGRFSSISPVFVARFNDQDSAGFMDFGTFESFSAMPNDGKSVQFDFDIKADLPVQLSLIRTVSGRIPEVVPYLYINPTDGKWKRFYVDLVHELSGQTGAVSIQVLFSINKPPGKIAKREICLDNLRLSYLK